MELKKFYAENMQEALKQIKTEIGPDAVIISSKMVKQKKGLAGLFAKKVIEVVVSYDNTATKKKPQYNTNTFAKQTAFTNPLPNYNPYVTQKPNTEFPNLNSFPEQKETMAEILEKSLRKNDDSATKIEELDESIGEIKELLHKFNEKVGQYNEEIAPKYTGEVQEIYRQLLDNYVEKELSQEIASNTDEIATRLNAQPKEVVKSVLFDLFGKPQPIQLTKFKRRVIMLIGPTGVGKTTTLVKLASHMVVTKKLKVGIINTDVYRVAAQEHLKAYCEILNTPLITIYQPEEIKDALDAMLTMDVVFIDTAGRVSNDEEYQKEIKALADSGEIDDIYLTLNASTSDVVLKSVIENYAFIKKHNIIITKIDEINKKGVLLYIAKISKRPISYLTNGQGVPDDIVEFKPEEVINSMF